MKFSFFVILLFLSSPAAIAQSPTIQLASSINDSGEDGARIIVIRPNKSIAEVSVDIYTNGQLIGFLGPRNYLDFEVSATSGKAILISKLLSVDRFDLKVQAGETYYVVQRFLGGLLAPRPSLKLVSEEKALKMLAGSDKPEVLGTPQATEKAKK